ncbi:polyketide synthase PksN [Tumebacillus sp. BK434]|uniref:type I polyketide synthase n=1 Tax=Tumebacillus sp. BK434 TaxID=2512169 RepID=UPI00104D82F7|nr:type I polyketide synthase [Tumebacillus sp. BK434]TCP55917.1 polyketide synthase PksN [Tumebacillus sp. BK434]
MERPTLKLDDLFLEEWEEEEEEGTEGLGEELQPAQRQAVAIIGLAGRVGPAESLAEFWNLLLSEREGVRDLPEARRNDLDAFLRAKGMLPIEEELYLRSSYLQDIAGFDAAFFGISQQEANFMDPNQRILLETAWKALEDAGYGGAEIKGSDTGLFVGYSHDFGEDYRQMLNVAAPDAPEISVAGNVKSIIASRLAYHLDLRGPSLLVDTACSSGLMAMYLACRALQSGDCSLAVVGAVKTQVLPVLNDGKSGLGVREIRDIHSGDGHTRTFDDLSDGTVTAEGSFAFVLKPLEAAKRDGDAIRAVILGGAANQDGASNGITAPNSEAQKDLISRALDDAGITAEQLSYIEAHGTATRLGDPIEISGIRQALSQFTEQKQFCAVGSLKSNIGHLDNAAGLGGMAKLVLAMQHRVLPASLHFTMPNRNIGFVESPVYVQDRTRPWGRDPHEVLYAGINSFGLSGTNCHLVVQSAPAEPARAAAEQGPLLLPLSAKQEQALRQLAAAYQQQLQHSDVSLVDAVFTAARGRMHHHIRAAIRFTTREELCAALGQIAAFGADAARVSDDVSIWYGEHRVVESAEKRRRDGDLTEQEREALGETALEELNGLQGGLEQAVLDRLAALYTQGADLPWDRLTKGLGARRISLPTYPFQHRRCWVDPAETSPERTEQAHPLLGAPAASTLGHTLFAQPLGCADAWELDEHRVQGIGLLPGTALVEMMVEYAARQAGELAGLRFGDITFLQPFTVQDGETKELHLLAEDEGDETRLRFASLSAAGEWMVHAEGRFKGQAELQPTAQVDLSALRAQVSLPVDTNAYDNMDRGLIVGDRWARSCIGGWRDEPGEQYLIELQLPEEYGREGYLYHLHPALMDLSVNSVNHLLDETELYLPLSYGELVLHKRLPTHLFAHLKRTSGTTGAKVHSFDAALYDTEGSLVLEVRNYCIKSASKALQRAELGANVGFRQSFRPAAMPTEQELPSGAVVLAGNRTPVQEALAQLWRAEGRTVLELTAEAGDWGEGLASLQGQEVALAVFNWQPADLREESGNWQAEAQDALWQGFRFVSAWTSAKLRAQAGLVVLTERGYAVEGQERPIQPGQTALSGLWRVAGLELAGDRMRSLDHDGTTGADDLLRELSAADRPAFLVYREAQAYEPVLAEQMLPALAEQAAISPDELIVISGGTGDLGAEAAELLVRHGARRLVLLGQQAVPPRGVWQELAASSEDLPMKQRVARWQQLEQQLDVLEVRPVQIEDRQQVEELLAELRTAHGRIGGVLHLAGRAGDGFLLQKREETFRHVYAPKAHGAVNLHLATLQDAPDFFVLFSSIAALELYPGQSDYTAANLFLDAFAEYRQGLGLPAVSLQWPAWRETGIAARMGAVEQSEAFAPLDRHEALALLERALWPETPLPAVLMPGRKRRLQQANQGRPKRQEPAGAGAPAVVLLGVAEPNETELAVAGLWAKTLGMREVDADEGFEQLGGNSLLASQLYREFEAQYPGVMHISDLFTYTTIRDQAAYLRSRTVEPEPVAAAPSTGAATADDLDELLELVLRGEMTVEESADRLVLERGRGK